MSKKKMGMQYSDRSNKVNVVPLKFKTCLKTPIFAQIWKKIVFQE